MLTVYREKPVATGTFGGVMLSKVTEGATEEGGGKTWETA